MKIQHAPKTKRGKNSREKILKATLRMLAESGSKRVTLDRIADACQISKSSILWYFGSKEALLLEVVDGIFRDLENTYTTQVPTGLAPHEQFAFLLESYAKMLDEHPEAPIIFFSFVFNEEFREKINDKIRAIYEWNRGALCEQFNLTEKKAAIMLSLINGIVIQAHVHPDRINIREIFDELIPMLKKIL